MSESAENDKVKESDSTEIDSVEVSQVEETSAQVNDDVTESGCSDGTNPEYKPDLVPIHSVLLDLAISLQRKVNKEIILISRVRQRLAREMDKVADSLIELGSVSLPDGFHLPQPLPEEAYPYYDVIAAIHNIYKYRDISAKMLRERAVKFSKLPSLSSRQFKPTDFNEASDEMDSSFNLLRKLLDEISECYRQLQAGGEGRVNLQTFSSDMCKEIQSLEKQYVMEKMQELNFRSCSIQSRKPVKSIGHTLDLQEISLLAKNAKGMVYEISLKMLKIVDVLREAEISCAASYYSITKENSELLRRYCFYLKLKIQQL